ncbi:hypothetical protein L1987_10533 [Smallanthus sonchifolius]|uniref:Uncharacterized protein n=1 Tax=Smallanthus sonchifolius TaxID=185202 RepID=A0ACB9JSJ5_9ASTR|nr:hypothetical protein L1987_10533 [Smallanthus sonchifolius]
MSLPRFFILGTYGGSYYRLSSSRLPSGSLKVDEEGIWSPRAKLATEKSETGDDTLVHIRSCYNNKYWVVQEFQGDFYITASANKPLEDRTNPACTLFHTSSGFQLLSIGASMYAVHIGRQLQVSPVGQDFIIVDWETLVILPSRVSFRSQQLEGNYLCSRVIDTDHNYHRFESGMDVADPLVANQLFRTNGGNYRIKDMYFGKFWRRSSNWILADAEEEAAYANIDTRFSFVKLGDNALALRNFGNNYFCGPVTAEGKTNCLKAEYPTLSRQTRLVVEERVMRRFISDVTYRLFDSRIYEEEILQVSKTFAVNDSPDKDSTITVSFAISDSRTTSWNNNVSVKVGVTVEFDISFIPFIEEGKVQVSADIGYAHEWGGSTTTTFQREMSYDVVVPPLTKKTVTLMCAKAACDVPYSYTQRDLLPDGKWVTTNNDDGIYTGINSYNFYLQSS